MRLTADQRGFTLVELLVSMTLGMLVLGGLFSLVTAAGHSTKRTSDRVDAAQRGRIAMESTIQPLRASVCLPGDVRPFVAASPTSVTWYANLDAEPYESGTAVPPGTKTAADPNGDGDPTYDPARRRLTYLPASGTTPSQLVEDVWTDPAGTGIPKSRILLTDLEPLAGRTGIFAYGAYSDGAGTKLDPFVPGDLKRIVRVEVSFIVKPTSPSNDARVTTTLRNSVFARVVNRNVSPLAPLPTYGCTT